MTEIPYYIHDLDPVLLPIWGNLAIRWYGLAYVFGFIAAYVILNRWGRDGRYPLSGEGLQSFMVSIVIGIMVGGRLGNTLFYDFNLFLEDPWVLFRIWEGGMASHGGMIGMALAAWYEARRRKISLLELTDGLVTVAPIGIGLGRIANFINGELWGRVTTLPWAVIFPQEAGIQHGDPATRELVATCLERGLLHPRHPSQLYQVALEGVLMLAVLMLLHRTRWARTSGRMTGAFLGFYTIIRFIIEFFREPEFIYYGWLSQGQLLTVVFLLPVALILLAHQPAAKNT